MGRPPKENPLVRLSVRLEPSTLERIVSLAESSDRSQSELVRLVVQVGLAHLEQLGQQSVAPSTETPSTEATAWSVIETARRASRLGLLSVPDLVKQLRAQGMTTEAAIDVLSLLAQQRRLELRPESGVGLLKPADAALCPRGMRGVVLSMMRVVVSPGDVLEAARRLAQAGLVELPELRRHFCVRNDPDRRVPPEVLDGVLLDLEERGLVDLKVANDTHGLDLAQGIRRGSSVLWFVAPHKV